MAASTSTTVKVHPPSQPSVSADPAPDFDVELIYLKGLFFDKIQEPKSGKYGFVLYYDKKITFRKRMFFHTDENQIDKWCKKLRR